MTRVVLLVVAVALGLGAAVLVATGFAVRVDGQQVTCQGPIVVHEGSDNVAEPTPVAGSFDEHSQQACSRLTHRVEAGAGVLLLGCVVAGSLAHARRREGEPVDEHADEPALL